MDELWKHSAEKQVTKDPHTIRFHLCEMLRTGKSTATESRLAVSTVKNRMTVSGCGALTGCIMFKSTKRGYNVILWMHYNH